MAEIGDGPLIEQYERYLISSVYVQLFAENVVPILPEDKPGRFSLGLDAQRTAVAQFLQGRAATVVSEHVEIESGSKNDRPQLKEALDACRRHKATLLIAKLDRLARNVAFVANLMDSDTEFVACDNPHASRLVLHILAAVGEAEREMIRERTRAALAAAKARGVKLGINGIRLAAENHREAVAYAATIADHVNAARASGAKTLTAIAAWLNDHGIASRQGARWHAHSVARVVRRLPSVSSPRSRMRSSKGFRQRSWHLTTNL